MSWKSKAFWSGFWSLFAPGFSARLWRDSQGEMMDTIRAVVREEIARIQPAPIFVHPVNTTTNTTTGFDPAKCPCNPANGGSGICGCVLSGPTVTC